MGRLDWLLAPLRAARKIPKPLLLATAASLAAVGGAFGIALAVVEWRDETADLAPVEEQIGGIDSSLSELGSRLDQIETRLNKLTPAPSPTPTPTPTLAPTARFTVNSVQVGGDTPGLRVDIDLTVENTSPSQDISYSSSQLRAIDDENTLYFPECWQSCGALLRPGEKVRSQMYFSVPGGTQLSELVWEIPDVLEIRAPLTTE